MASKWQIDKETSTAKPNEKLFEKVERLKKRVAWNLDINQDDKTFLEKYETNQPENTFDAYTDNAERVWEEAVKLGEEEKEYSNTIFNSYKDIFQKEEDEILRYFHEISLPLTEMKIELEEKLKKSKTEWMSDEEKLDLNICLDSVKRIFKGMEPEDLRELISGTLSDEEKDDDSEYEFTDCFPIFESFQSWRNENTLSDKELYEKYIKVQYEMNKAFVGYLWHSFGIDESPLNVMKFYEENINNSYEEKPYKECQEQWNSYLKSFFYNKKKVNSAAKLLLNFYSERSKSLNGEDEIRLSEENIYLREDEIRISEVNNYLRKGFVYLIRNQDIFKIGITENLLNRMSQLEPDEIIDVIKCSNFRELERDLHRDYKEFRIPQTEYFRLNENQLLEVSKKFKLWAK